MKVIKLKKEELEDAINGLSSIKTTIQEILEIRNYEGKGNEDSEECGKHFETAINAMITVLGLMESNEGDQ